MRADWGVCPSLSAPSQNKGTFLVADKSTKAESIMTAHRLSDALRAAVVRRADAFALTLCAAVPRVITAAHGMPCRAGYA